MIASTFEPKPGAYRVAPTPASNLPCKWPHISNMPDLIICWSYTMLVMVSLAQTITYTGHGTIQYPSLVTNTDDIVAILAKTQQNSSGRVLDVY